MERFLRLGRTALSHYGLADAALVHRSYLENVLFEVRHTGRGVHASLRICRHDWDGATLRHEVAWLDALAAETDLRVPRPMPTATGDAYCVVESPNVPGPRACLLLGWVPGAHAPPDELTPSRMRAVGRLLARLHGHAETFRLPPEHTPPRVDAATLREIDHRENVATYFRRDADLVAFDRAIAAAVELMRDLGDGEQVAGIIHGDLHQRNYVFDEERVGALDFETLQWGYYLYDLATTLSYLVPEFLGRVDPAPLRAALLEGYEALRRLPDDHERLLAVFSAYRVWIMADWSSGSPRMLKLDWARRRLEAMPGQIRELLAGC